MKDQKDLKVWVKEMEAEGRTAEEINQLKALLAANRQAAEGTELQPSQPTINPTVLKYKLADSHNRVYAIAAGHFLFMVGFYFSDLANTLNNPHYWICGIVLWVFLITNYFYKWTRPVWNKIAIGFYLALTIAEFSIWGVPPNAIGFDGLSQGVLLDLLVAMMPYVYFSLRFLLVIPLFQADYWNRKAS